MRHLFYFVGLELSCGHHTVLLSDVRTYALLVSCLSLKKCDKRVFVTAVPYRISGVSNDHVVET